MKRLSIYTLVAALLAVSLMALANPIAVPSAREAAMAGAVLATATGFDAQLVNPAGVFELPKKEAGASFSLDADGGDMSAFGFCWAPLENNTDPAITLGYHFINADDPGTDYKTFVIGYADQLDDDLVAGISAKWITADNGADDAEATSLDFGVIMNDFGFLGKEGKVAAVLRNVPSNTLIGEKLAATIDVGVAVNWMPGLLLEADLFDVADEVDRGFAVGGEYDFGEFLGVPVLLRGGYNDPADVWSVGAGLSFGRATVDYGLIDLDDPFHMITVGMTF